MTRMRGMPGMRGRPEPQGAPRGRAHGESGGLGEQAPSRPRSARRCVLTALAVCALTAVAPASGAGAAPRPGAPQHTTEQQTTEQTTAQGVTSDRGTSERVAAAVRSGGPLPDGVHGPVVTHPVQQPVDYPAGEVCPFAAHADFPVNDLTLRTWYDDKGRPVFATESGPLVMDVTNLATGRSVTRDISGSGTITYPGPHSHILSGSDWGVGLHTSDRPVHNKWIISRGYMSVKITEKDGKTARRLLALHGPYEDLCVTLAK